MDVFEVLLFDVLVGDVVVYGVVFDCWVVFEVYFFGVIEKVGCVWWWCIIDGEVFVY